MGIVETLTLAERARQLREPEGAVGLAVARWTSENNRIANEQTVAELGIEAGDRVLEIGFGDGRSVCKVIAQAADVQYTGIDPSPTMVEEAIRVNGEFFATGRASFIMASAQNLPFDDNSFDRVFSIGVAHFWTAPEVPLAEVRRVLRAGGLMLMGCLAPGGAPTFALPEYGFHLRKAHAWDQLCRTAGFSDSRVEDRIVEQRRADGTPVQLHVIRMEARA